MPNKEELMITGHLDVNWAIVLAISVNPHNK